MIDFPGKTIVVKRTNFPTPAPILAFLDFCVKIKFGKKIIQYFGLKNLNFAFM